MWLHDLRDGFVGDFGQKLKTVVRLVCAYYYNTLMSVLVNACV